MISLKIWILDAHVLVTILWDILHRSHVIGEHLRNTIHAKRVKLWLVWLLLLVLLVIEVVILILRLQQLLSDL